MKETNEGDLLEERCDSPRRVYASETRVVTDISYKATNFFLVAQSNLNRVCASCFTVSHCRHIGIVQNLIWAT